MKLPRHAELWLAPYLADRARAAFRGKAKRLNVAITDHWEPMGGGVSLEAGLKRTALWLERWPQICSGAPADAGGNQPRYTFFYPQEEYRTEILSAIEPMHRAGMIDVDIHIHHNHDTAATFTAKMSDFIARLHQQHGMLRQRDGRLVFGFIHGNWALDNSRPDGEWCGVTGELQLLRDLGCYADFTMPSLPSPTQGRILNQVYWTTGDPSMPKGFNSGVQAAVGGGRRGDLLMVTGPLGLRYRGRLMPRMETGELAVYDQPTPYRVERWLDLAPRIGDDIFLKLYGHTAREDNAAALLGTTPGTGAFESMFRDIHRAAARHNLELHWTSAYEMFNRIDTLITQAPQ